MYEQLRFEIRDGLIEIVNKYPSNSGAPGQPRGKKKKKTPEEVEKQNIRNREKTVQRLIQANFREGDFHLILKYRTTPETYMDAKKDLQAFLASVRRAYKKAGYMFKYIGVTEKGSRKAVLHHHLIIENIQSQELNTVNVIQKLWEGHCAFMCLYQDGEFTDLAAYIVKKETKEENKGCTYTRSRNLKVPVPKKVIFRRKIWPEEPKIKKGWYLVKNTLESGFNRFTGRPYQTYLIKSMKEEPEDPERSRSRLKKSNASISMLRQRAACLQNSGDSDISSNTSRRRGTHRRGRVSEQKRGRRHSG